MAGHKNKTRNPAPQWEILDHRLSTDNRLPSKQIVSPIFAVWSFISAWENGVNSIDIDTLFRVCKIFGVTVNDMYEMTSSEPTTIAAHFDGDEYTEDELDEIRQFAEFVKNKRK